MQTTRCCSMGYFVVSILAAVIGVVYHRDTQGFELAAHSRLTRHAFERSLLREDPGLLAALGLPGATSFLGSIHFDAEPGTAGQVKERIAHSFDSSKHFLDGLDPGSIPAWLVRGAIREDDLSLLGCIGAITANAVHLRTTECNPRGADGGDPHGDFDRVLHHFYDPYYHRGFIGGEKAPNWATGSIDAFNSPNQPYLVSRNHFSLMAAREAMFRALTGRRSSDRALLEPVPDGKAQTPEQIRNAWWATAFRALGDAVHLVQDMAQPQHTRNDAHPGSVFEGWMDARALGAWVYSLANGVELAPLLDYGNHPIPRFDRYSHYWSTGPSGLGLADYSNREFFTEDSNFGSSAALQYPSPASVIGNFQKESAPLSLGVGFPVEVNFLRATVHDRRTGAQDVIRMTTESVFEAWAGMGIVPVDTQYSMNRQVYDAHASLLVPRAVAYSAGLIDYFFRGRLDFHEDPDDPPGWVIRNLGPEDMKGTFTLYYDDVDGERHAVAGSTPDQTWIHLEIPAGGQVTGLTFAPPVDPAPRFPGEYTLVFTGEMGNERPDAGNVGAVAAKYVSGGELFVSALRSGEVFDLYRSSDLGSTWTRISSAARGPTYLHYLGDGALLSEFVLSLDAGLHWIDVSAAGPLAAALRQDAASGGGSNVIGSFTDQVPVDDDAPRGLQAVLTRSGDFGATWPVTTPIPGMEYRLRRPAYLGDGRYVALGKRYAYTGPCDLFVICDFLEAIVYGSSDSGATWQPLVSMDLDRLLYLGRHAQIDGKLVPDADGQPVLLANRYVGGVAEFVRSLDGGHSWTTVGFPQEMQAGHELWHIATIGNGVVMAYFHGTSTAATHAMYLSADAGETWQRAGDPPANTADPGLYGIAFIPSTRMLPGIY